MEITLKQLAILGGMKIGSKKEIVTNPFSKEKVELQPEAVALYDIIMGCQFIELTKETLEILHTARSIFYKNWPKEYNKLID